MDMLPCRGMARYSLAKVKSQHLEQALENDELKTVDRNTASRGSCFKAKRKEKGERQSQLS